MALRGSAFWFTPKGIMLDIGSSGVHIRAILEAPEKFGTTRDEVEAAYQKHGEKLGVEGKAREEIILEALKKGFLRIRLYPNRYWSITTHRWTKKEQRLISRWAEYIIKKMDGDKYMDVQIVVISDGRVIKDFTVQDLWLEQHYEEKDTKDTPYIPHIDITVVKNVNDLPDYQNEHESRAESILKNI